MKWSTAAGLVIATALLLSACSSVHTSDYADARPNLDMLDYFRGDVHAWGIVQDRSGKVIQHFTLTMHGQLLPDGDLAIHEVLDQSDGKQKLRDWRVHRADAHHVSAIANGIVGEAKGEQYGDALHLQYVLEETTGSGSVWQFPVDDWFFLQSDGGIINRSTGSKWGFHAFDVITFFQKAPSNP